MCILFRITVTRWIGQNKYDLWPLATNYRQSERHIGKCFLSHLVELESSSVSLLQVKVGFGAPLGRHLITTLPFLGARTLFRRLRSNVGAQAKERQCGSLHWHTQGQKKNHLEWEWNQILETLKMSPQSVSDSPNTSSSALAYMSPWRFSATHWYIPESSNVRRLKLISFLSSWGNARCERHF